MVVRAARLPALAGRAGGLLAGDAGARAVVVREAHRRGRDDVVGRLEKLRARSATALGCILEDLEESRDLDRENGSGEGRGLPDGDRYS